MDKGLRTAFLLEGSLILLMGGCHTSNPTSPAPVPPVVTASPVTLAATVVDSTSGLPIAVSGLTLSIYSQAGTTPLATYTNGGGGVFAYVPTASTTTTYRLVATAKGYDTLSQFVTVPASAIKADGSGLVSVTLKMINTVTAAATVPSAPAVIATVTATGTAAPVTTTTPATASVPGVAAVTIPASTQITNSVTNTAVTGAVTLNASYSNTSTAAAITSFPSGFNVYLGGSSSPTSLLSGGGATFTLTDASGNEIPNPTFTKPVQLTVSIPTNTWNPLKSRTVQAGDSIPVWSYDSTGLLVQLALNDGTLAPPGTVGTLVPAAGTNAAYFPVTFNTDHFCFFDLAWALTAATEAIDTGLTVTGAAGNEVYGQAIMLGWANLFGLSSNEAYPFVLSQVPTGLTGTITLFVAGTQVGTASLTAGQAVNIDITNAVAALAPVSVTVNVKTICTVGNNTGVLPSVSILAVSSDGKSLVGGATNSSGSVTLVGLKANTQYNFKCTPTNGLGTLTVNYTPTTGTTNAVNFSYTIVCDNPGTGLTGTGS